MSQSQDLSNIYTHYGDDTNNSIWILHGILGSRQNWGAFAKSLIQKDPTLSVYTIDLLAHGDNHTAVNQYDIQACVQQLLELHYTIGGPHSVIGHSFGGKVALAYAAESDTLKQVWSLDTSLDAQKQASQNEVLDVIQMCRQVQMPQASRRSLMTQLQSYGASLGVAQWMTTNLKRSTEGFVWRFNLNGIESLIHDYWHVDAWQILQQLPNHKHAHVLRAENGLRWSSTAISQITDLDMLHSNIHAHILPHAGHWVHIDQPKALLQMIYDQLSI